MAEYWEFNSDTFWLEKAQRAYENAPSIETWDKVIQEIGACKERHQLDLEEAKEHLARLERLIPDMEHKKKNRETYTTR